MLWPNTQNRATDLFVFLLVIKTQGNHPREGASSAASQAHYNSQNAPQIGGRFRACVPAPRRGGAWRRSLDPQAGPRSFPWPVAAGLPPPWTQRCGDTVGVGTMRRLGSVQRKMPCVFVTEVKAEPSAKREHQVPGGVSCWAAAPPTLSRGPGGGPPGFPGEVWVKFPCAGSSSFFYLLRCKECGRDSFFFFFNVPLPDQVIQTCSDRSENPHRS